MFSFKEVKLYDVMRTIEDNELNLEIGKEILTDRGFEVEAAEDGMDGHISKPIDMEELNKILCKVIC